MSKVTINTLINPLPSFLGRASSPTPVRGAPGLLRRGQVSEEAARAFGYSPGAFRVLCSFRNNPRAREFLLAHFRWPAPGVRHHDPVREENRRLTQEKLLRL